MNDDLSGPAILDELRRRKIYGELFSYEQYQTVKELRDRREVVIFLEGFGAGRIPEDASASDMVDAISTLGTPLKNSELAPLWATCAAFYALAVILHFVSLIS